MCMYGPLSLEAMNDKCYVNKPQTITELKAEIEAVLPEKRYDQQLKMY